MGLYLADVEIRHAVAQLARSSARSRMCEYLIGLRTLRLMDADEARVAESIPAFVQAVDEFTRWTTDPVADPYFNPFGQQAGYKSKKFVSNGPSNTMHGWATQPDSPFKILDTKPKGIQRRSVSPTQLGAFLLLSKGVRPRLLDAAVWFYRNSDLSERISTPPSRGPDRAELEMAFLEDVALGPTEADALFRRESEDGPDDDPTFNSETNGEPA